MSLLSKKEAAAYLSISPKTLDLWRSKGEGPTFIKAGEHRVSRVLYDKKDLDKWIESRKVTSNK